MKSIRTLTKELGSNPPKILAWSFLGVILLGTLLLMLPISHRGDALKFSDSLFTATSAVCVTGLTTVETATAWTGFGKMILLCLIQIGGWGIMTVSTLIAMLLGRIITLQERLAIQAQFNEAGLKGMVRLIRYILASSLLIEGIGAVLLMLRWHKKLGWGKALLFGVFHSISAYCNAGFDLFGNSLAGLQSDPISLLVISSLIVLGGLGFSVYFSIHLYFREKKKLNLHAKVVLWSTCILLFTGTLLFGALEWNNPLTLGELSLGNRLSNAFFQSVTTRTAGFYSFSMEGMKDSSSVLSMMLMFIGGSPAGTAGGIKTTTFVVLLATMLAELKGNEDVVILRRRINPGVIRQALSIIIIGVIWVFVASFLLIVTEEISALNAFFEVFSGFATVGLSRGVTTNLGLLGKSILILTMYVGRVGTLTMGYAFAKKKKKKSFREIEGNIMVG